MLNYITNFSCTESYFVQIAKLLLPELGSGETIEEAKSNLRQAIELILEDRKADILRGLPEDAIQDKVMVG